MNGVVGWFVGLEVGQVRLWCLGVGEVLVLGACVGILGGWWRRVRTWVETDALVHGT